MSSYSYILHLTLSAQQNWNRVKLAFQVFAFIIPSKGLWNYCVNQHMCLLQGKNRHIHIVQACGHNYEMSNSARSTTQAHECITYMYHANTAAWTVMMATNHELLYMLHLTVSAQQNWRSAIQLTIVCPYIAYDFNQV